VGPLAWANDRLECKAFEANLTDTERAQFNDYRLVLPWRCFAKVVELDRAETLTRLVHRQHHLRAGREAIRHSKSTRDNLAFGAISSLTDGVRALHEKIRAARAV